MSTTYAVQCFNCLSDYDALEAIWCSCNPQRPTKVCPFCMGCFCAAGEELRKSFWDGAPQELRQEIDTLSECRMLLGEMLVRAGLITTTQLLEALTLQKADGRRLGEILVDSGALPPDRLERFLQSQHTVMAVDVARARVDATTLQKLGVERCLAERILPLEAESFRDRRVMTLAMADPSDGAALQRVVNATGHQVIPGAAPAEAIVAVIRSIFPEGSAAVAPAPTRAEAAPTEGDGAAVGLLSMAIRRRASHLHIQGKARHQKVFFRIDGTLYLDRANSTLAARQALATLREMAGIDEGRLAGRATFELDGVEHSLIVRTRSGKDGEDLSVKILDPVTFPPRLEELGYPDDVAARIRAALERPRGLILVSSPPFSGSSSTLYALVMEAAGQG
ncbi:MAG: ATPase, T2SS/T4P/T4SS family, partial [Candidatus Rokuibacteriota bacterium]